MAPWHDPSGQVTVHRFDDEDSSWKQLGQSIRGDNKDGRFSILSVSLCPDGNTLVIGSTLGLGGGYVQVFSLANVGDVDVDVDADTWTQIGQRIVSDANGNDFGWSVAISDNGRTLAVGAPDFI